MPSCTYRYSRILDNRWVSFNGIPNIWKSKSKGEGESAECILIVKEPAAVLSKAEWGGKLGETWEAEKRWLGSGYKGVWVSCSKVWTYQTMNPYHKLLVLGSHNKKIARKIETVIKVGMKCNGRLFDIYFGFHIQLLLECGLGVYSWGWAWHNLNPFTLPHHILSLCLT